MAGARCCLVNGLVARITILGSIRVRVVNVTIGAEYLDVSSGQRKLRVVVIKRRRNPRAGTVTDVALLRNPGSNVVGLSRALIILQMTADTGGLCTGVLSSDMTGSAVQRGVHPGQSVSSQP